MVDKIMVLDVLTITRILCMNSRQELRAEHPVTEQWSALSSPH